MGFGDDYKKAVRDIISYMNKSCGFNVYHTLKIIWAISFVITIVGTVVWINNPCYMKTFVFFILPIMLYGVIIILDDWMKDKQIK